MTAIAGIVQWKNLPSFYTDPKYSNFFDYYPIVVYAVCMSRTNVDIDDTACAEVMRRYRLTTKREAVNFALRTLAAEPLDVNEARRLRGSGWEGNLDELRSSRLM